MFLAFVFVTLGSYSMLSSIKLTSNVSNTQVLGAKANQSSLIQPADFSLQPLIKSYDITAHTKGGVSSIDLTLDKMYKAEYLIDLVKLTNTSQDTTTITIAPYLAIGTTNIKLSIQYNSVKLPIYENGKVLPAQITIDPTSQSVVKLLVTTDSNINSETELRITFQD